VVWCESFPPIDGDNLDADDLAIDVDDHIVERIPSRITVDQGGFPPQRVSGLWSGSIRLFQYWNEHIYQTSSIGYGHLSFAQNVVAASSNLEWGRFPG